MWKELKLSTPYYIQYVNHARLHILITDYKRIWETYLSQHEFIKLLTENNVALELEDCEFVQKGIELMTHIEDLKNVKIFLDGPTLTIYMSLFRDYPFKLKLVLKEGSRELFFQEVTQPALKIIHDLKSSENELRKLLIGKDTEIKEYESQNVKIRYTALPKYNDKVHMEKHSTYETYFGEQNVPYVSQKRPLGRSNDDADKKDNLYVVCTKSSQEVHQQSPQMNNLIQLKQELNKNELPQAKRRQLNLM